MVALDVEGVLLPEIWIAVAERTGIEELRRTTRDEPDYDSLMRGRLDLLDRHGLTLTLITDTIAGLTPLPGAVEFLDELRSNDPGRPALRHVRRVRQAADGPARLADDPVPQPRDRRRPHRRLPAAAARPEAPSRAGVPGPRLQGDRRRGLVQRRLDAAGRRCRVPLPRSDNVRAEFPQLTAYDTFEELAAAIAAAGTGSRCPPVRPTGCGRDHRPHRGGRGDSPRPIVRRPRLE